METVDVERIQRQIVLLIVESARLKHEAKTVSESVGDVLVSSVEDLGSTAERITVSIVDLYALLPEEFLPTAGTLRAIERDNRIGRTGARWKVRPEQ